MKEIIWMNHVFASNSEGHALKNYNLTIFSGEAVIIYGDYGSGKHVVRDILLGNALISAGSLYYDEKLVKKKGTAIFLSGIEILDGCRRLIPKYSVYENMFIFRKKKNTLAYFPEKAAKLESERYLKKYGMDRLAGVKAVQLNSFEEQIVLLLKAKINRVRLILFDFVSYSYSEDELRILEELIRELKSEGISFLFFCERELPFFSFIDKIQYMANGTALFLNNRREGMPGVIESYQHSLLHFESHELITGIYGAAEQFWKDPFSAFGLNPAFDKKIKIMQKNRNTFFIPENAMLENMDIQQNICVGIYQKVSVASIIQEQRVKNVIEHFYESYGVSPKKNNIAELTEMEKKMLVLYRYELLHPQILVIQEPFIGMNDMEIKKIWKVFLRLAEKKITLLLFSESLLQLKDICKNVIVYEKGGKTMMKTE